MGDGIARALGETMPVSLSDYADHVRAVQWFDIDPRSVDNGWTSWASLRVYAYVPNLMSMIDDLVPIDYAHLASVANVAMADFSGRSIIRHERLTAEQLRFVTGSKRDPNDPARTRAVRVDKALLSLFAINHELERQKCSTISPKIFLSAFNIQGASATFNRLVDKERKLAIRRSLADALQQTDPLASEFLKGSKVTLDAAILAHRYLLTVPEFSGKIVKEIHSAIETPSDRHTPAAASEKFARGRVDPLPEPFKRSGT